MAQANYRLLLNAEPFGFGPSAAIASIVPILQKRGVHVSYMGERHTLDLQRNLSYEAIYDITDMSDAEKTQYLKKLASNYDLFITAMDFAMAEIAQRVGIKTIIYDALTWYWPKIHPAIKNSELYLAQNFFGVEQRLRNEVVDFPESKIVAPLVSIVGQSSKKDVVLLNMGGLQNPYWSVETTLTYAQIILNSVKAAVPASEKLVVTTSELIAKALGDQTVTTLERSEMIETLKRTRVAFMTPGLGNIYDAASFRIPTLWLPPANDSQGQQARYLVENDCSDAQIFWDDIGSVVDYSDTQTTVLQNITDALHTIIGSKTLKAKLTRMITSELTSLNYLHSSKTEKLLKKFGTNGADDICLAIEDHLESRMHDHS